MPCQTDGQALPQRRRQRQAIDYRNRYVQSSHFAVVVAGDEVAKGKPHPEIFLTAARRLTANPADCVVFLDSAAGVRGAHAAGMIPILVPDLITPSDVYLTLGCVRASP